MPFPQRTSSLTIHLTPEHLGFLAYLYPNEDPEDALIKLLESARNRAILRAEQQVRVLHPGQGEADEDQEEPVSLAGGVIENPISELQELCQRQQISMPRYKFEVIPEGFRCIVWAIGLEGVGEGRSKKQAKVKAAEAFLGLLS